MSFIRKMSHQKEGRRYMYGVSDEKFITVSPKKAKKHQVSFKFRVTPQLQGTANEKEFNKTDVPIVFKCKPDTLLNLCLLVLDAIELPQVYDWSIEDICKWLRNMGFQQYQNTFRVNLITGRNLLLLDASALAAMNIKDFVHIQKITDNIRKLFYYEMVRFGRCLTLYPDFHENLYKLVRLRTGAKYNVHRSDLWRKMQLIRQKEPNHTHWEILEKWLDFEKPVKELIGGARRFKLYACKPEPIKEIIIEKYYHCFCIPPCECYANELNHRRPWNLKSLPHRKPDREFVGLCSICIPPCNCGWAPKNYQMHGVLTTLKDSFPHKYDSLFGLQHQERSDQVNFSFRPRI